MSPFVYRIIFLLFVVAGAIRLSAQTPSSDIGVWIVGTKLAGGDDFVDFEEKEKVGFGLSLNHYWTERFSTELSTQKFSADTFAHPIAFPAGYCGFGELPSPQGQPPDVIVVHGVGAGKLEVTAITAMAQLHFNREGRVAPYVGAGVAYLSGDLSLVEGEDSFELESEIAWAASAGLDVRITDRLFVSGEMKFIPWSAMAEDDPDDGSLDIDPLIVSVGMKVRF